MSSIRQYILGAWGGGGVTDGGCGRCVCVCLCACEWETTMKDIKLWSLTNLFSASFGFKINHILVFWSKLGVWASSKIGRHMHIHITCITVHMRERAHTNTHIHTHTYTHTLIFDSCACFSDTDLYSRSLYLPMD